MSEYSMVLPDYQGGSLVNLMTSLIQALGGESSLYPPLHELVPSSLRNSRNIILMVIDGLGYEFLMRVGRGTTFNQYLQGKMTSVFPSTTATAITTFLTGTAPQQHALTGWHIYFKELGCVTAVLPFRPRHGGPRFRNSGVDVATLLGHVPVFNRIRAQSYIVAPSRIIDSEFNTAHSSTASRRPYSSLPEFFGNMAKTVRETNERKYIYAYYPDLDRLAHDHGIGSRETRSHLAQLDTAFGGFLNHLKGSGTTVIVTADHGFIDSPPDRHIELGNHPALAQTLIRPLCGGSRVAYCYVHPEKRAQFERYIETQLFQPATLFKSEQLIDQGYFGLGPPHPHLRERIGHYTLIMQQNYMIQDWLPGEQRYMHIGVHGGLSEEEMYVPLIVVTT